MGAADVVPGVSGGTIAFITNIYEELLNSIRSFNLDAFKALKENGIAGFWKHINGNFLVALFIGIATSILTLSKLILYLLATHPILIWSFFFGLIVASALYIAKEIKKWRTATILSFIIGTAIAYLITIFSPAETPTALWFIFLSGALAICAMILPGISGSFILLLLGKYEYIFTALKELKLEVIFTFMLGCIIGLLSFSRVLSWMFKYYRDLTIALLSGFMLGSLNKVWPWKETISTRINSHGEAVPVIQKNISPAHFENLSGEANLLGYAIILCLFGFLLVLALEKIAKSKN